ncbi:class I SAM-dependent methyltransferase [Spongiimicrobium salis]|uniref:class I SAM-dependent methyltransferase n=1 Tax=Spongiimicrobium salis TaxID=1667022 RepID=UPI00374D8CE7
MKNTIRPIIGNLLSATLGNFFVLVQPQKADELSKKGMTLMLNSSDLSIKERLMRRAILKKTEKRGNHDALASFHQNYWINKGHDFFLRNRKKQEHIFLPDCEFIFDLLQEQLSKNPNSFNTLVEIGTGDGNVLQHLSTKFPQIEHFVGIDLSEVQTETNTQTYKENPKLQFVAADGFDWIKANGSANMIFVTFMGVLEYFTEQRLQQFFDMLYALGNIMLVAIEPNGLDHDFSKNPNSQTYGFERSFSHNYPMLLKNSGFELWHNSKKTLEENTNFIRFIGAMN